MYAIYGDIYHQCTPNLCIYTSTMDPMGRCSPLKKRSVLQRGSHKGQHGDSAVLELRLSEPGQIFFLTARVGATVILKILKGT